jgi:ABC-type multidrug transport system permease subunit
MNDVSEKNEIIRSFVLGVLAFAGWIILMIIQPGGFFGFLYIFLPLFFLLMLIYLIDMLSFADINIDETGKVLIVTTLFNEKQIPLDNFEIKWHKCSIRGPSVFVLYTQTKKIVIVRSIKNYDALVKLFEYINYKNSKYFHANLLKLISIMGLDALPGATFETYEKIKMRAGMNDN